MPESVTTTPHREGVASAVEAAPGAALAVVLVWASKSFTRHPLDIVTAGALVSIFALASSYVIAWIRQLRRQINTAVDRIIPERKDASSADAVAAAPAKDVTP